MEKDNMSEEKLIEFLKEYIEALSKPIFFRHSNDEKIEILTQATNLIDKQQKEIEELKEVIKMVEIYKSHEIPENTEMVIMCKDNFLRNANNEFISKDKIREKIKKEEKHQETIKKLFPDSFNYHIQEYAIEVLKELLEE